jgi:hypothetical protein
MTKSGSLGRAVTACAAIAVVTSGCGGGHPIPAHSATSSPAHPSPASSVPTGAELATLLPPQASLPPGWQEPQTDVHDAANSGSGIALPVPAFGPIPSLYYKCDNWDLQFNPDELSFLWRSTDADALVKPPGLPPPSSFVSLALSAYKPGDVAKQFAWDVAFAKRCHSYRFPNNSPVTTSATTVPGPGDQDLFVQLRNPALFQGQFIRAHISILLTRVGNVIIGVEQAGNDLLPHSDPVMPMSDFTTIASWLVKAVERLTRGT